MTCFEQVSAPVSLAVPGKRRVVTVAEEGTRASLLREEREK
jgi:hypothetical protein